MDPPCWLDDRPFDPQNPRDRGVTADRLVVMREGHRMRIIGYADPVSGEAHEFLANGMDLPAGVLAELYRRRWGLEEVFDGSKNELGEKKAWGTTLAAQGAQGQWVALPHELLRRYEERLEREQGVTNTAEDDRRQERNRPAGRPAGPGMRARRCRAVPSGPPGARSSSSAGCVSPPGKPRGSLRRDAPRPTLGHVVAVTRGPRCDPG